MIKLTKSTFYNEEETKKELIKFIVSAKLLSFGPECEKFERRFAKYQGRKHCIFVNSGSAANLAIIQALINLGKIKRGDLVGFSALTWSTNVMPLIELGLRPVPIDVELDTLNVSSRTFLKALKRHPIKLLFLTNLLGFCDDIDEIKYICDQNRITLLEDNCESLGSVYKNKKLGNYGWASTFSFYVGHHMSTIEGGAVTTDSEHLASMLRIVRAHGWDRNLSLARQKKMRNKFKVNSTFYSRYTFYDLGYNMRTTEISGFLGNAQLKYLPEITTKRRQNFMRMALPIYKKSDKYYAIKYEHMDFLSNFAMPVICKSAQIRDELVARCAGKVEIRPIVGGDMVQQPYFQKHVGNLLSFDKHSNARVVHEQGLYFGNNPELTSEEMDQIIDIFTKD